MDNINKHMVIFGNMLFNKLSSNSIDTFAMAGYYLWELRHKDTAERNKNEMDLSSIPRCVSSITF